MKLIPFAYTAIILLVLFLLYVNSLAKEDKCDLILESIDYTVSGVGGTKEMLYGDMSDFSYVRQQVANKLKHIYDQSNCY